MSLATGGAQEGEKGEEGGGLFMKALKSPGRTLEGTLYEGEGRMGSGGRCTSVTGRLPEFRSGWRR